MPLIDEPHDKPGLRTSAREVVRWLLLPALAGVLVAVLIGWAALRWWIVL